MPLSEQPKIQLVYKSGAQARGIVVVDRRTSASWSRAHRRRKYQTVAREAPSNFVADLQRLRNWPSMKGSLWRRASLVKLTHALNARLLTGSIRGRNLKILDVGCGTGCISLELSRMGHDVLGLDRNERMIEIATRTKKTSNSGSGKLQYEMADFDKWVGTTGAYDAVIFSRVLHDLPDPQNALLKAHGLLKRWSRNWKSSCWEQARFSQPSSSTRERKHDAYHVRSSCRELTQHTLGALILLVQSSFGFRHRHKTETISRCISQTEFEPWISLCRTS